MEVIILSCKFCLLCILLQASKYINAAPMVPKFEEQIRDLAIGSYMSHGNFICASAAYMAFNWDIHGSNLAVLPIDVKGRQNKGEIPLIYAHGDFVTDFEFSPFDDGLLATGSQDSTVKQCPISSFYGTAEWGLLHKTNILVYLAINVIPIKYLIIHR